MPSVTRKQHNFFNAVKHNPAFAQQVGVSRAVAQEFLIADQAQGKFKPKKKKKPQPGIMGRG